MKRKLKKGFTLVELLVVIAILAILATVSIVGYSSFTKKANLSNDNTVIAELNRFVDAYKATDNEIYTVTDAQEVLDESGFDLSKIKTSSKGYHYAYDIVADEFSLLDDSFNLVEGYSVPSNVSVNLFAFVTSETERIAAEEKGYSTYLQATFDGTTLTGNVTKGIDVGKVTNASTINYVNTSSSQNIVIRTNSASTNVAVNAPLDTVKHYGSAGVVDLQKVATTSYFEYGSVAFVELTIGRIVLTEESDVEVINVTANADGKTYNNPIIADAGVLEENMPEIISRDQVIVTDLRNYTELVQIQKVSVDGVAQSTEQIYAYASGTAGTTEKTDTQNTDVTSTLALIAVDSTNAAEEKAYSKAQKTEEKDNVVTKAVDKEIADADESGYWITCAADSFATYSDGTYGDGTKAKPYLIKTARQLALLAKYTATSLSNTIYSKYCNASVYYELGADIDLSGKAWTPICQYSSNPFLGHFDGKGYTISNLTNNGISVTQYSIDTDYEYEVIPTCTAGAESGGAYGLFAIVGEATISNINFENFKCENPSEGTGYRGVGAVAGLTYGKTANSTLTITNCNVLSGNINVIGKAGGIVGDINDGGESINCTINNCSNYVNVTVDRGSSSTEAGGIVGRFEANRSLTLDDCHNYGIIKSSSSTQGHIGGLIGCYMCSGNESTNTLTINNSSSIAASKLSSPVQTGLIIGTFNGSYATITFDFENISIETKQENSTYNRTLITDITNCQIFGHNDETYGSNSELDYTYTVNESTTTLKYSIKVSDSNYSSSTFTLKNN